MRAKSSQREGQKNVYYTRISFETNCHQYLHLYKGEILIVC